MSAKNETAQRSIRSWATSLLLAGSIGPQLADACVQLDLIKIENSNGVITDYLSQEDELKVWLGVGDDILISWSNDIEPW